MGRRNCTYVGVSCSTHRRLTNCGVLSYAELLTSFPRRLRVFLAVLAFLGVRSSFSLLLDSGP